MDHLNSVTLRGIVGCARRTDFQGTTVTRLTVATNYAYRNTSGEAVLETTWTNVVVFDDEKTRDALKVSRGDKVELQGRLRCVRTTDEDGTERASYEVLARQFSILNVDMLQMENS